MDPLFPGLPQDLKTLTADELNEALRQIQLTKDKVVARDPEVLGDLTMAQVLEELTKAADAAEAIREELNVRQQADQEFEAELKKLDEKVGAPEGSTDGPEDEEPTDDDGEGDGEGAPEEAAVEAEAVPAEEAPAEAPVPVLASAGATRAARPPLPKPSEEFAPLEAQESGTPFVIASGIPGYGEGKVARDGQEVAKAVISKLKQAVSSAATEKVVVASANYGEQFPEGRKLYGDLSDMEKIQNIVGEDALVASGGLCAPVTPYYELQNVSVADRPVRDALAGFNAVRGGINAAAPPTLAGLVDSDAVGIKTEAQDAAGGTSAVKSCLVVECPDFEETFLSMVYHCLQFGNLNSRAFPEMIAVYNELVLAAHARIAETALLDGIGAASTAVTSAKVYGGVSSILYTILRTGAGMRSRHRMRRDATLRAIFPAWAVDFLIADLVNSQFTRFSYDRAGVENLLRTLGNIEISWTLDGATGASQVFGTQSAGAVLDFPDTVVWYIFPEGAFLFLDGGTLDLGIVRDSSLNSTNDFQIFGETFENVAFVGVESLKVTSTVCPTGETGPTATAITC